MYKRQDKERRLVKLDAIDVVASARANAAEQIDWWENPHMIQDRFADLICSSAAELLSQPRENLALVPGGATWLGKNEDLLVFVFSDLVGKKYVISAKFVNRRLEEYKLL